MIPANFDFTVYQGDTFELPMRLRAKNPDGSLGDPINLSSMTGKCQVRAREGHPDVMAEMLVEKSNQEALPGWFTLKMTPEISGVLVPGKVVYDLQFADLAGVVKTYIRGSITVIAEITRV